MGSPISKPTILPLPELPPWMSGLGMFPNAYATTITTLKVNDKWSTIVHDEFSIATADAHEFLKISGLSGEYAEKRVMDVGGKHLFTIEKKTRSFSAKYLWKNAQDQIIMEVVGEHGLHMLYRSKAKFEMDGKPVELDLEAHTSLGDEYGVIKYGGAMIASIRQTEFYLSEGQQDITVAANVDKILIAGLVICIDVRYNEREQERMLSDERRERRDWFRHGFEGEPNNS